MSVPRQPGGRFDERRNTSRVFPVVPGSSSEAVAALQRWARAEPEHARWIAEGHPSLTDAEHRERFGVPYKRSSSRPVKATA
jgi:hypothetical protein